MSAGIFSARRTRPRRIPLAYGGHFGLIGRSAVRGWLGVLLIDGLEFRATGSTRAEAEAKARAMHQQVTRSTREGRAA